MYNLNKELAFVILADSIDYIYGVGMIPIWGDVLDVLSMVYLASVGGIWYFIGSVELIPAVDIFPTFTGIYIAKHYIWKRGNDMI